MNIRVLRPFSGYKPGQLFQWGDGAARILISRGLIAQVDEVRTETAMVEERTERAAIDTKPRKRQK